MSNVNKENIKEVQMSNQSGQIKKKPHWSSSDQVNIYFCLNLTGLEGCVHPNPWTVLTLN